MWPLVLYLGLPAVLAIVLWRVEEAAAARKRDLLLRAPSAGDDGVELKVRVDAGSGQRVSLGSSVETPEAVSATPTLTVAEVALVEEAFDASDGPPPTHVRPGRRLALEPGASMVVAGLPGARRKPLDIETTQTGVLHHYSFELAADKVFWISGLLAPGDANGPFRGDASRQLAPLSGANRRAYIASAARGAKEPTNEGANLGLGWSVGVAAFAFALSFTPYLGPLFWVLVVGGMMIITIVVFRSDRPERAPLAGDAPAGPNVRVIIRADESATDEETEGEAAAETAEKNSRA
ncbi:MAG: hypothetical protein WKG00_08505 [Polyangiaceae bacterium]